MKARPIEKCPRLSLMTFRPLATVHCVFKKDSRGTIWDTSHIFSLSFRDAVLVLPFSPSMARTRENVRSPESQLTYIAGRRTQRSYDNGNSPSRHFYFTQRLRTNSAQHRSVTQGTINSTQKTHIEHRQSIYHSLYLFFGWINLNSRELESGFLSRCRPRRNSSKIQKFQAM